jgi:hypothetical protein
MTLTFFMALFAPLLILLGFAALCLGMEKHCKEHLRMPISPQNLRRLRVLGWFALLLSFAACVTNDGWQVGPLVWFGWLSVLGMSLVFARPWILRG